MRGDERKVRGRERKGEDGSLAASIILYHPLVVSILLYYPLSSYKTKIKLLQDVFLRR